MLHGRRILLVGGCGFIGHNLALALTQMGAEVFCVDSLGVNNLLAFTTYKPNSPKNARLYKRLLNSRLELLEEAGVSILIEDARHYHALSKLFDEVQPDSVIHLAAVAHAGRSNKSPHSTFDHSLRTLENALDCARGRVEHFIYFSSSMVYGHFKSEQVTEETPCEPLGIYGALKFAGEKIVIAYGQTFDLPYTIIRPSALYGERCVSRRVGQIFIESALADEEIRIHGCGDDKLDFTYIQDLVQGISRVLTSDKAHGEVFNLTYGESRSIQDLFGLLQSRFPNVRVKYEPKDNLTPDRGTLCIDKARELLGYSPEYPLEKGFPQYINWFEKVWPNKYDHPPSLRAVG